MLIPYEIKFLLYVAAVYPACASTQISFLAEIKCHWANTNVIGPCKCISGCIYTLNKIASCKPNVTTWGGGVIYFLSNHNPDKWHIEWHSTVGAFCVCLPNTALKTPTTQQTNMFPEAALEWRGQREEVLTRLYAHAFCYISQSVSDQDNCIYAFILLRFQTEADASFPKHTVWSNCGSPLPQINTLSAWLNWQSQWVLGACNLALLIDNCQ